MHVTDVPSRPCHASRLREKAESRTSAECSQSVGTCRVQVLLLTASLEQQRNKPGSVSPRGLVQAEVHRMSPGTIVCAFLVGTVRDLRNFDASASKQVPSHGTEIPCARCCTKQESGLLCPLSHSCTVHEAAGTTQLRRLSSPVIPSQTAVTSLRHPQPETPGCIWCTALLLCISRSCCGGESLGRDQLIPRKNKLKTCQTGREIQKEE